MSKRSSANLVLEFCCIRSLSGSYDLGVFQLVSWRYWKPVDDQSMTPNYNAVIWTEIKVAIWVLPPSLLIMAMVALEWCKLFSQTLHFI